MGGYRSYRARQGYDLALARYADEGWRATFYSAGKERSATSASRLAWEPTAWRRAGSGMGDAEQA